MQCSAAIDILFLMDGSYSVGKGSFERSKHYVIKLCQALDVGPDKVGSLSLSLFLCLFPFLPLSFFPSLVSLTFTYFHGCAGARRRDSVWFLSSAGVRPGLVRLERRAEEAHQEDFSQVCFSSFHAHTAHVLGCKEY